MKKSRFLLSFLLAFSFLLTLFPCALAADFSDVPDNADYAPAIEWASENGYINGYSDGRFGVDNPVTRAQLAAILYRAAGSPAVTENQTRFSDVNTTAYYYQAVSWAENQQLIQGYSDGRFGVNNPVTRQQVTAIFWRWAGSPDASAQDYPDETSIANYARTAVDWSRTNNLIAARPDGNFAPNDSATRVEIVSALYRYRSPSGASNETGNETSNGTSNETETNHNGKTLIAYYSATGSTQAVAETIANTLDGDLFVITPTDTYTSDDLNWTNPNSRVNHEHDDPALRDIELITSTVDNWDDYDTVFIGYPIWWGIAAWPVDTFIKANDFTDKTVIPFCTSSSSGLGQSGQLLADLAGTGDWQEGRRFQSSISESDVINWVQSLDLSKNAD